jgi:hypothetical protein
VRRLLSRLLRLLDQDRIRLPRRTLEPRDIRSGDRLQIGQEIWRVGEGRPSPGPVGGSFVLTAEEASAPTAVLFAPGASDGFWFQAWLLIKGCDRIGVPGEMIIHFPAGLPTTLGDERRGT